MTTRNESTPINTGRTKSYDSTLGTEVGEIGTENQSGGFEITPGQVYIPLTQDVSMEIGMYANR